MLFKLPMLKPAELMAKLTMIKSQHPEAKVVIDINKNCFYSCADALAYHDVFSIFSSDSQRLDIEVNIKVSLTQFLFVALANLPKQKIFIAERVYVKWINFNDFLFGTEAEQTDRARYFELVNTALEKILVDRYDMDLEEMAGLIEGEEYWEEDDILAFMECSSLDKSEADRELPAKLELSPEPIVVFDDDFNSYSEEKFSVMMDTYRQAGYKEAVIIINTPGGSVISLEGMLSAKERFGMNVRIIAIGLAASAGAVFLASGAKGQRVVSRHTTVMIHQFRGGGSLKSLTFSKKLGERMTDELSKNANVSRAKIEELLLRDYYMDAEEAVRLGLADAIIG